MADMTDLQPIEDILGDIKYISMHDVQRLYTTDKIRNILKEYGISVNAFAAAMNTHPSSVTRFLHYRHIPSVSFAYQICWAINSLTGIDITIDELFFITPSKDLPKTQPPPYQDKSPGRKRRKLIIEYLPDGSTRTNLILEDARAKSRTKGSKS
ncbi:MAG: helix-turn-helix transcriptional regulator [Candidatus Parvarchaeum sp.]